MRNYILLLLIFTASACSQASDNKAAESSKKANDEVVFDTLLNQSATRIVDLTAPGGLSRIDVFMIIYNNPEKYKDDVKRALTSNEYSELKKRICIYSMQKLDYKQYYDLTNYCFELFEEGKVSERVMRQVIMPGPWKTEIRYPEKYKDQEVQQLMKKIRGSKKLSQAGKDEISRILSGQTLKSIQEIRQAYPEDYK